MPVWIYGLIGLGLLFVALIGARIWLHAAGGGYYVIPSSSMEPTLPTGAAIISVPYDDSEAPARGDVVVFKHPSQPVDYIARVIGVAGDEIALSDGIVMLNGAALERQKIDPYLLDVSAHRATTCGEGAETCPVDQFVETLPGARTYRTLDLGPTRADTFPRSVVPEDHLMILGDNRDNSVDSRFEMVGFVPKANVKSRAWRFFIRLDGGPIGGERVLQRVQ